MKHKIAFAALLVLAGCSNQERDTQGGKEMAAGNPPTERAGRGMTIEERRAYRDKLMAILPEVPEFTKWVKEHDQAALPPDFDALPKRNALPDPMTLVDGKAVKSPKDWKARRAEILEQYQKYVWGRVPPRAKLASVEVTAEAQLPGYRTRSATLHFGPEGKGTLHVSLVIPDGKGPFPVLMGPSLIGGFGGGLASTLLRRGYITASYAGNDGNDDSKAVAELYPDFDFATLPRRAWSAGVLVDYLEQVPEADKERIAITGYSRDGKQVLIAAALDERIKAVVAGSPGVGGLFSFRYGGELNQAESIQSTTLMFPDWFVPGFRFFAGREDRLPVDGNLLLAAIAPRPVFEIAGYNDEVSNDWGDEQSIHSAQKVYDMLGAPNGLGIYRLPGFHGANDVDVSLDFLDFQFGRSARKWENHFIFSWDLQEWQKHSGEKLDISQYPDRRGADLLAGITTTGSWEKHTGSIRHAVIEMLGDEPVMMQPAAPRAGGPGGRGPGRGGAGGRGGAPGGRGAGGGGGANPGQVMPDVPGWVIQRSIGGLPEFGWYADENNLAATRPVTFGANVRGTLYYPKDTPAGTKLPTVVWLHSYSYPLGYMWVYHRELHPILALVKAGYAVLAYDQAGFGSRMAEQAPFADRYPHWSMMGRLVEDARAAVDTLGKDAALDPERIYLFGYGLGGNVAVYTAAMESKVKGIVSICGFTPMRTDTADKGTGGIARLAVERGLIPRLGFFIGQESKIPYDYDELIAAIAPRPVYVVSAQLDRAATPADVHTDVESARKVYGLYGATEKLKLDEPWDYNRLSTATQDRIIAWMKENMK